MEHMPYIYGKSINRNLNMKYQCTVNGKTLDNPEDIFSTRKHGFIFHIVFFLVLAKNWAFHNSWCGTDPNFLHTLGIKTF